MYFHAASTSSWRADAKAVVVVEALLRRVGPAFVNDQAPIRVRMFEGCFAGFRSTTSMARSSVKTGNVSVERAALVVAGDESCGF